MNASPILISTLATQWLCDIVVSDRCLMPVESPAGFFVLW